MLPFRTNLIPDTNFKNRLRAQRATLVASHDASMAHIEENQTLLQTENQSDEARLEKGEVGGASVVVAVEVPSAGDAAVPLSDAKAINLSGEIAQHSKVQESPTDSSTVVATTSAPVASLPARPTLVQLGSSTSATHSTQQKKFSASNINKKFLEKTSTSGSAPTSSSSLIHKPNGGPISRPAAPTTTSHPRLVTTKLTGAPQSLSPGPGWSRPSSATPTIASGASPTLGSVPNGAPLPSTSGAFTGSGHPSQSASASTSSQLPHAGKLIQPQPRSALLQMTGVSAKPNPKPVWGNTKSNAATAKPMSDPTVQTDFPTAAEVAQGASLSRKTKQMELKTLEEDSAPSKQVRNEEADTFRGVHLDPNAHHWDEMEEDGDDFLNNVIEFNDGRQYKIESVEATRSPTQSSSSLIDANGTQHSRQPSTEVRVSKEERFGDDFDRSWPRSKPSPAVSTRGLPSAHAPYPTPPPVSASPVSSHQPYSPTEGPRVLFNERLNKLEPFRPSHDHSFSSKRSDNSTSPSEFRRSRDLPPHHASGNVQLLQKQSGSDFQSGPRSRDGGVGYGHRDRDPQKRDTPQSARFPLRSPRMSESFGALDSAGPIRDREPLGDQQRGRRPQSSMGPPPVPAHARDPRRQAPPHLSQTSPSISTHRLPSRDSAYPPAPSSAKLPPPPSPALSQASVATTTSALPVAGLPPNLADAEIDSMRKDLMHDAAERAKQRRQAEEAEREKERERARQKAAQLEEKLKAAEIEKQHQDKSNESIIQESAVVSVIEEAVRGLGPPPAPSHVGGESSLPPLAGKGLKRPPSLTAVPRPGLPRRTSQVLPSPTSETPAARAESWRSKANPVTAPPPTTTTRPAVPRFSAVSALHQIESSLAENPDQHMEIVDFSDLGKFVDPESPEARAPAKEAEGPGRTKRPRPVALDFFDGHAVVAPLTSPHTPSEVGPWRRKPTIPPSESRNKEGDVEGLTAPQEIPLSPKQSTPDTSVPGLTHSNDRPHGPAQVATAPHPMPHSQPRTPRAQHFSKDMSAIDDAMLRIKGAIDGMHDSNKEVVVETTLEASNVKLAVPHLPGIFVEVELPITRVEPPPSPGPAWHAYHVQLPKISVVREPISKSLLYQFRRGPRWVEISSLPPPHGRPGRPDFSVTELLFGKPKVNPRVSVPRLAGFKSNMKMNTIGAFGKPSGADNSTSWRKPTNVASPTPPSTTDGLETTSRSPPPDAITTRVAVIPSVQNDSPNTESVQRRGSLRKMPVGSAVAVYRDSRIDVLDTEAAPAVNFTVGSELDDTPLAKADTSSVMKISQSVVESPRGKPDAIRSTGIILNGDPPEPSGTSPLISSKAASKASDSSSDHGPRTPATHTSSLWSNSSISFPVKESPVREGVDHPHLKDLWTQISEKPGHPTVNSLERIEDELPTLPSTLQDVKSEGGETPPPSSTSNHRMSQFDVTRGFQQVPSSTSTSTPSASTSHRPALPPAPTSAPVARPPSYNYPMAASPSPGWPMYNYSPMMAPSPAPVMYGPTMTPSPVPARMAVNGQATYAWVPATPVAQPPAGMIGRMPSSPYPMHIAAYHPSAAPALYGASPTLAMQSPQAQGNTPNRGRNPTLTSPVVAHASAHPYYANQPMMMQPSAPHGPNHVYPHDPGRGPMRHDNGHPPMPHHPVSSHPSYGPTPSTSFPRPW